MVKGWDRTIPILSSVIPQNWRDKRGRQITSLSHLFRNQTHPKGPFGRAPGQLQRRLLVEALPNATSQPVLAQEHKPKYGWEPEPKFLALHTAPRTGANINPSHLSDAVSPMWIYRCRCVHLNAIFYWTIIKSARRYSGRMLIFN
jgi:hypothetical protein